jgi:hypothetical protein
MKLIYVSDSKGRGVVHKAECSHSKESGVPFDAQTKDEAIRIILWAEEYKVDMAKIGDKFADCVPAALTN